MRTLILAAYGLDIAIGDPHGLPHPVRWIGAAVKHGESIARRRFDATPQGERLAGALLTAAVIGATATAAVLTLRLARRADRRIGRATEIVAAASALATRDLLTQARSVLVALRANDLPCARTRVARIVGRDTDDLDAAGIARAVIETLGESTCDGIVAPLFYLACGGASTALVFKAVSTLDSMIGHHEAPYRHFGTAAARLDDLANLVPARLSALVIAFVAPLYGGALRGALTCVWRDARKHRSPNAGFPECALAGALGVRLGGPSRYHGIVVDTPPLNPAGRTPNVHDISKAIGICALASCASAMLVAGSARRA